jgi:hypothetical protein
MNPRAFVFLVAIAVLANGPFFAATIRGTSEAALFSKAGRR